MRKGWRGITAAVAACAVAVLAVVAMAGPAGGAPSTALLEFVADGPAVPGLSGLNENPQHPESSATGTTTVFWDTTTSSMTVIVGFDGLTTPNTAAHIHCCVTAPGNAGVATTTPTFTGFPGWRNERQLHAHVQHARRGQLQPGFRDRQGGVANAAAAFLGGLQAGRAYMNIHSQMFGGGEVRGFLHPAPCADRSVRPAYRRGRRVGLVAPGAMVLGPITVNPGGALDARGRLRRGANRGARRNLRAGLREQRWPAR